MLCNPFESTTHGASFDPIGWHSRARITLCVFVVMCVSLALGSTNACFAFTTTIHWVQFNEDGTAHMVEEWSSGEWIFLQIHVETGYIIAIEEIMPVGNPKPDGGSTGLGPEQAEVADLMGMVKQQGGDLGLLLASQFDPLTDTPMGRGWVENGTVPGGEIDPWEGDDRVNSNAAKTDPKKIGADPEFVRGFGGGSAGGGLELNVPLGEQINKKKNRGKGKGSGSGGKGNKNNNSSWQGINTDPTVIDPSPELFRDFLQSESEVVPPNPIKSDYELLLLIELLYALP